MTIPAQPSEIWLVEDNDLYRETIAELIASDDTASCGVATAGCEELLAALETAKRAPDVVLMDIGLPGIDGVEGCRRVRERSPETRVVMLTVHEERDLVFDAIRAGASGYLLKSASPGEVLAAIRQVAEGGAPINAFIAQKLLDTFAAMDRPRADYALTPRESEILALMVDGLTMQAIADRLAVSYHTVDSHIRNIYDKLHVHTRGGAVAKAIRERLV